MNKLHPGARWIFRLQIYGNLIFIGLLIIFFISPFRLFFLSSLDTLSVFTIILLYLTFSAVIGEIYVRMAYNRYFYELASNELKIEHGIIWKKYSSIPFERVQNVEIKRGVLARIFGFSTLEIETAGKSRGPNLVQMIFSRGRYRSYKSEGHLPALGINEAQRTRELVIKKIKKNHASGL